MRAGYRPIADRAACLDHRPVSPPPFRISLPRPRTAVGRQPAVAVVPPLPLPVPLAPPLAGFAAGFDSAAGFASDFDLSSAGFAASDSALAPALYDSLR